ncbi:protein TMEPAI-like isoform X2 [Erpetoichthys calabaricus]|uniref:protein TMEPAI-like isoform X2 n=1 Tax=Erpetoichthys calabaricus TaxID=27687 RepID=UPI00109EE990|nr:protein TMEPAI-like isoform X2 [Erpetoichthys calabaricus]XP_039590427.1 protein TMEPAI-like isoform X2 [Polypterus senegalus]
MRGAIRSDPLGRSSSTPPCLSGPRAAVPPGATSSPGAGCSPSMFGFMGLNSTAAAASQPNVSCTCNCKRSSLFQSMEITQLEFVQIIIIVVVLMVMVVVITCLLNHYKLSARSFINRHSQVRRREETLSSEGTLWPSDSAASQHNMNEMYTPRTSDRLIVPSYMQRDRFHRFQPTYPYLQHEIDLPPTISLSDGEEPPPYQGPCTLQLRDPEQQLELNRESVRAPPNRTIFDSDLIDSSIYRGPCPPSSNSGISATCYGSQGRMEGPPPTYSEVIGHCPGSAFYQHTNHSNNQGTPPILGGNRLNQSQLSGLDSTNARNKEQQKVRPF